MSVILYNSEQKAGKGPRITVVANLNNEECGYSYCKKFISNQKKKSHRVRDNSSQAGNSQYRSGLIKQSSSSRPFLAPWGEKRRDPGNEVDIL